MVAFERGFWISICQGVPAVGGPDVWVEVGGEYGVG